MSRAPRYLMQLDGHGILLGTEGLRAHWSEINPDGLASACTFRDEAEARLWERGFFGCSREPIPFKLIPVKCDYGEYASVGACVKAGIAMWDCAPAGKC